MADKIQKDLQCSGVPCSLWRADAPTERDRPLCVPATGIVHLLHRVAPFGSTHGPYLGLCTAARAMGRGKGGRAADAESRVEEQGVGWAGFLKLDGAREAGLGDTRRSAILIKMGLGWAWGHSVDLGDLESHDRAACRNQS